MTTFCKICGGKSEDCPGQVYPEIKEARGIKISHYHLTFQEKVYCDRYQDTCPGFPYGKRGAEHGQIEDLDPGYELLTMGSSTASERFQAHYGVSPEWIEKGKYAVQVKR